jgi:periplasmic divalent cation tolerance protein
MEESTPMTSSMIYITTSSRDEALRIGRALVTDGLAACANVLPGIISVYRWQGEIQEDDESSLILKTRSDLVERLTARVKELHSYDCPCLVALPITDGNPDFLHWIAEETR